MKRGETNSLRAVACFVSLSVFSTVYLKLNLTKFQIEWQYSFAKPASSSSKTSSSSNNSSTAECEAFLDIMDARFDAQQKTRPFVQKRPRFRKHLREYFDPYEPEAVCFTEERFGSDKFGIRYATAGDGAKFVCGVDFLDPTGCLVYSIGSQNKIGFEAAIHNFVGCEIHTFDPTVSRFKGDEHATFHPWGLGADGEMLSFPEQNVTAKSLSTIMSELNHTGRKIDILKIDCEHCEYQVMHPVFNAIAAGELEIDQIQMEVHATSIDFRVGWIRPLFSAADRAGFRIFHKERNQWGCDGHMCLEYSFASRSFLRKVNREVVCNHRYVRNESQLLKR